MGVRNILVAFNGSDSSIAALRYAASIARSRNAYVTTLLAHAAVENYATESRWIPAETRSIIATANAAIVDQIETGFQSLMPELGLDDSLSFMRASGRVDAVLSECARNYDMIAVGRFEPDATDSHVSVHPDRIALLSGRPVLVVPESFDAEAEHSHAVLAWDGSRASARALSDSMQLLEGEGRLTILTVGDEATPRPVSELQIHLERHDIEADHVHQPTSGTIGNTILEFCREADPNLLVMGAYEHSKFREDFFGGLTTQVIERSTVPVLLSH